MSLRLAVPACEAMPTPPTPVFKKNFTKNSLARHWAQDWARDWFALALTQIHLEKEMRANTKRERKQL